MFRPARDRGPASLKSDSCRYAAGRRPVCDRAPSVDCVTFASASGFDSAAGFGVRFPVRVCIKLLTGSTNFPAGLAYSQPDCPRRPRPVGPVPSAGSGPARHSGLRPAPPRSGWELPGRGPAPPRSGWEPPRSGPDSRNRLLRSGRSSRGFSLSIETFAGVNDMDCSLPIRPNRDDL